MKLGFREEDGRIIAVVAETGEPVEAVRAVAVVSEKESFTVMKLEVFAHHIKGCVTVPRAFDEEADE